MQNNNTNSLQGGPELRKRLPYGAIKSLAQKHEKTIQWVSMIVNGEANPKDQSILEDAYRLAEIEDLHREQLKSAMK